MEGLIIGGNFAFQNGLDLTIKTASTDSPWAYIQEGLLSESYRIFNKVFLDIVFLGNKLLQ